MKMSEPAADLALALAVASSAKGLALPADLVAIGEVGPAGLPVHRVAGLRSLFAADHFRSDGRRLARRFRARFSALVLSRRPADRRYLVAGRLDHDV